MRPNTLSYAFGIAALAWVGCGGSSSPADAGNSSDGAAVGTDGNASVDGKASVDGNASVDATASVDGSGASSCSGLPTCVNGFNQDCPIAGTICTQQSDMSTLTTNQCYSNGVKLGIVIDLTNGNSKGTVKKPSGAVCYSFVPGTTQSSVVYKNAAGQTLFTLTADSAGNATITCPGGTPVALPKNCDNGPAGTSPKCSAGTCAP